MIKRLLNILILTGLLVLISVHHGEEPQDFNDYFDQLNEEYEGDRTEILTHIENKLQNNETNSIERGINLLARQHYLYLNGSFTELIDYADETENYLIKHKQDKELLHLYSILASRYSGMEQYNNAYIYIYRGEQLAEKIYDNEKNKENLSTLMAIKYLKAVVALEIGMIQEADAVFSEAEELRNNELITHERVDVYDNIVYYHKSKKNYELVEEYAFKLLEIIKEQDPNLYNNESPWIRTQFILAQNYLYQEELSKCLEIVEQLKTNETILSSKKYHSRLYPLYAEILLYYNQPQEALNYFIMAYEDIKDSVSTLKKLTLVYNIINILIELDNDQQLLFWYKIRSDHMQEVFDIKEAQYLLNQIIDTDLQNAKYSIEVLQLQKTASNYFIFLLCGVSGLSLIVVLIDKRRKMLLKTNMTMLERNMQIKHQYYEDIKLHQDNLKRVKHDLKNHMVIIHKLIIEADYEGAKKYIQSIAEKIDFPLTDVITENKIIDAILINKLPICHEKGINLQLDIQIPKQIPIEDFDLCVIYGNLLDNAIEACEQMSDGSIKYIKLKSFIKEDYLYVNMKNSFSSELKMQESKLMTLKKDKSNHGLGIENIQKSVKKYDGHMKVTHEKQEFNVSILLNII